MNGSADPMEALRGAYTSGMASSALAQIRVLRVTDGEVELVGPAGAIGVFRQRVDDLSRVLSGALGRRVRAVLTPEAAPAEADGASERAGAAHLTMESARDHPLVAAARRAFDAEVQRVDPIPHRPNSPEPSP